MFLLSPFAPRKYASSTHFRGAKGDNVDERGPSRVGYMQNLSEGLAQLPMLYANDALELPTVDHDFDAIQLQFLDRLAADNGFRTHRHLVGRSLAG